jgi:hypothetical protein
MKSLRISCQFRCARCKSQVSGTLYLDGGLTVCDSVGFIITGVDEKSVYCDPCAERIGMPGHEIVTEADLTDSKRRDNLIDKLARGLNG